MDDTAMMGVSHRVTNPEKNVETILQAFSRSGPTRGFLQPFVESDALHELHREIGNALVRDGQFMHRKNVRVFELAGDLSFGDEAIAIHRLAGKFLVEPLEGNPSQQIAISCRVHTPHAAMAKLAVNTQMRRRWNALRLDLTLPHFVITLSGNGFNHADRLGFGLAFSFFTHECSFEM